MTWNAHRPGQFASRESLAERRALPITGIRQDAAKTYTGRDDTIQLGGFSMAAGQADEHERTMAFAEIALGQIKALRQPASPRNYEIWYAYATGYQPSLDQRINETLKQNDTLSEADLEPIDETFLSPRRLSERIDNVGSQVRGEIEQVMAIDTAFVAQNFAVCVAENKNVLGKKFLPR
jgi:hypothetical protein